MRDILPFIQKHLALSLSFGLLVVLIFFVELLRMKRGVFQVTPAQLTMLINHKNAAVIDLRPADAFQKGHILGAVSLPLSLVKDQPKKLEKFKTRPLVLVCAKGLDSPKLATTLKAQGFHVHTLRGGVSSWQAADLPLSTKD